MTLSREWEPCCTGFSWDGHSEVLGYLASSASSTLCGRGVQSVIPTPGRQQQVSVITRGEHVPVNSLSSVFTQPSPQRGLSPTLGMHGLSESTERLSDSFEVTQLGAGRGLHPNSLAPGLRLLSSESKAPGGMSSCVCQQTGCTRLSVTQLRAGNPCWQVTKQGRVLWGSQTHSLRVSLNAQSLGPSCGSCRECRKPVQGGSCRHSRDGRLACPGDGSRSVSLRPVCLVLWLCAVSSAL